MKEADLCRTLVRPKLTGDGWDGDKHFYSEQTPFTDDRIMAHARETKRLRESIEKERDAVLPSVLDRAFSGQLECGK